MQKSKKKRLCESDGRIIQYVGIHGGEGRGDLEREGMMLILVTALLEGKELGRQQGGTNRV